MDNVPRFQSCSDYADGLAKSNGQTEGQINKLRTLKRAIWTRRCRIASSSDVAVAARLIAPRVKSDPDKVQRDTGGTEGLGHGVDEASRSWKRMNSWWRRWRCMLRPITVPSMTFIAANGVVVPCRS